MYRHIATAALLAVLAGPGLAQEVPAGGIPKSGERKVAFLKDGFPFEGEITVERLNVRLFPRTDGASIIAAVLHQGERVTVVSDKEEFFEIMPPRGATVWVFGRNVKKEAGDGGVVIVNDTPVRLDSRTNAEKLANLPEGTKVKILKEHLGWYQIAAPQGVKYFVSKKYVKPTGDATETAAAAPKPDADAKVRYREAEELAAEQNALLAARQIRELDFGKVAEKFEAAAALARNEEFKSKAESEAKAYRRLQAIYVAIDRQMTDSDRLINELREKIEQKKQDNAAPWDFTGYVDTVGALWNRPGTHKLIMGDKIVTFIRTKDGDEAMRVRLNGFFGKYVGVRGTIHKDPPGWGGYTVVVVEAVEDLRK